MSSKPVFAIGLIGSVSVQPLTSWLPLPTSYTSIRNDCLGANTSGVFKVITFVIQLTE